jgi:predicted nucleotidyltransferase
VSNIENIISRHLDVFHFFNEVYLFGSSLDVSKYSNDIDLLLIYKKYSKQIETERKIISSYLEKLFKTNLDITILSELELELELEQTKFLERLNSPHKRIK